MTTMADVRLDVHMQAEERATAALKAVQSELRKTEQQIQSGAIAAKREWEVDQLLIAAKDRKRQKLADERREHIQATRAAAESNTVGHAANERLKSAAAFQEKFNKVLGLAGFVGAGVAAAAALGELIVKFSDYGSKIEAIKATQESFNRLLAEVQGKAEAFDLGKLTQEQRTQAELVKQRNAEQDKARELDAEIEKRRVAILANDREIAAKRADEFGVRILNEAMIRQLEDERRKLLSEQDDATKAQAINWERINTLTQQADPTYRRIAETIERQLRAQTSIAKGYAEAVALVDQLERKTQADFEAQQRTRQAAGAAYADRIRSLERQLALERVAGEYAKEQVERAQILEDIEARRLTRREGELRLRLLEERSKERLDARLREQVEDEEKRSKRDSRTSARTERADAKDRAQLLEEQADRVRRIGTYAQTATPALNMLSEGLGGVSEAIASAAESWAKYEAGQQSLGSAIASTLGITGAGVAQAIGDKGTQALIEGGFEQAAAIASFASGNVGAGIGHQAAALAFFGVAADAGVGGSKSGGGARGGASSSGSRPASSPQSGGTSSSSRRRDEREMLVVQFGRGIVYGLGSDVAQAAAGASDSLRGTGMHRRRQ